MHSTKATKAPKQQKQKKATKQQKRKLTTKKPAAPAALPKTSSASQFTSPSFKKQTTKRTFSTKANDGGDDKNGDNKDGNNNDGAAPEGDNAQPTADADPSDPLVIMQKRIQRQSQEIADLKRMVDDNKVILEEWQHKTRQLQERVKHEIEEQHNIHDRYKREIGDVKKFAVGKFAKGLLEGIDALEAASKATDTALQRNQDESFQKLAEGLNMTTALFHKALSAEGIHKFESLGKNVDPNLHFITAQLPHPSAAAGTITHLLKEGYHIHDRVLRPAQVVVATSPTAAV